MKTSEVIRKITKAKCELRRHGSNHDIWFSPITKRKFQTKSGVQLLEN